MARAFGDFCLKDYGLIAVPDVSYRRLTEKDEFIVLATDGVSPIFNPTHLSYLSVLFDLFCLNISELMLPKQVK